MRVEPTEKCHSYVSHDRAVDEADRFFAALVPDESERRHAVYWCIVPQWFVDVDAPRWTVLAFILRPEWHHLALSIARHRWRVTA